MCNPKFVLLSVLVILSLLLGACTPATTVVPAPTDTAAPSATPRTDSPTELVVYINQYEQLVELEPTMWGPVNSSVLLNVYETLITYRRESVTEFVPLLATEVPSRANGGISPDGLTYVFKLRTGVRFQQGGDLTASDAAYSLQRAVLHGGNFTILYMLNEPLLGVQDVTELVDPSGALVEYPEYGSNEPIALLDADPALLQAACEKVKAAIVADDAAGTLTIHLAQPWPGFLHVMVSPFTGIIDKQWAIENEQWDDSCATWQNWYPINPYWGAPPLPINGTGPFTASYGENGVFILERNPNYWRTEPAWEGGPSGPAALEKITLTSTALYKFDLWLTFITPEIAEAAGEVCTFNLETGLFDACQAQGQGALRLYQGIPAYLRWLIFMQAEVATSEDNPNPLLGSGKLDGEGIPPTFFSDVHIRRAFNYCLDRDKLIQQAFDGNAQEAGQITMPGMPGYDPAGPRYSFDLAQCEAEFKLADVDKDGIPAGEDSDDVWQAGFHFSAIAQNLVGQMMLPLLAETLAQVNPRFKLDLLSELPAYQAPGNPASWQPLYVMAWVQDIYEAQNWYRFIILGNGRLQWNWPADVAEELQAAMQAGLQESDPARRAEIYRALNQRLYEEALVISGPVRVNRAILVQPWVEGFYLNPYLGVNYYALSKK